MSIQKITRLAAIVAIAGMLPLAASSQAVAGGTRSLGHGVKCSWVLVSSVNGVNTYQNVCRRGI